MEITNMSTTNKGNNSYPKHGLPKQNNGSPTRQQLVQRGKDKGRIASTAQLVATIHSIHVISFAPRTVNSRATFKARKTDKWGKGGQSKSKILCAGGILRKDRDGKYFVA